MSNLNSIPDGSVFIGFDLGFIPRPPLIDWRDVPVVERYFSSLPVVRLLSRRLAARLHTGEVFSSDFSYLYTQVFFEWMGLFGYSGSQIIPGLRVPLPKDVVVKVFASKPLFQRVSQAYFHALKVFGSDAFLAPDSPILFQPNYAFNNLHFSVQETRIVREGLKPLVLFRVIHQSLRLERFYSYDSDRNSFSVEPSFVSDSSIFDFVSWTPVSYADSRLSALFFPPPFRQFWDEEYRGFFAQFHFTGFFPENYFTPIFELPEQLSEPIEEIV